MNLIESIRLFRWRDYPAWIVWMAHALVLYPIAALVLGGLFVVEAGRLIAKPDRSMALFRYSTIYLAVLFAVIWVDTAIG